MQEFKAAATEAGAFSSKRRAQRRVWLRQNIADRIMRQFESNPAVAAQLAAVEAQVLAGTLTPGLGAAALLNAFEGARS